MPTYDYVCRACGHRFEHFQSMQEPALRKCPECRKPRLERLIGAGAGILFKGSGFYETDYKRKSPSPPASSSGAPKGGDGGPSADGSKSVPKPEAPSKPDGGGQGGAKAERPAKGRKTSPGD